MGEKNRKYKRKTWLMQLINQRLRKCWRWRLCGVTNGMGHTKEVVWWE